MLPLVRNALSTAAAVAAVALIASASSAQPSQPAAACAPGARCCPWAPGVRLPPGVPYCCALDVDCDDGVFCNGQERCRPTAANADARGCIAPTRPACDASAVRCNEGLRRCETPCTLQPDADQDGHRSVECGGDDCDDKDPNRHPGLTEICDPQGHDEDCDPFTTGAGDKDGDGFLDVHCKNVVNAMRVGNTLKIVQAGGYPMTIWSAGTDCDDDDPTVGPNSQQCTASGVRVCERAPRRPRIPHLPLTLVDVRLEPNFRFVDRACAAGHTCVAQPNGTGICEK